MLSHTLLLSGLVALSAIASPVQPVSDSEDLTLLGKVEFYNDIFCGTPSASGHQYQVFAGAQTIVPFNNNIHALKYSNSGAGSGCVVRMWRAPSLLAVQCDTSNRANLVFEELVSDSNNKCLIIEQVPQCIEIDC
ncbi:hypothetical protein ESCO_005764 [Escovopsis weberi]|uniref:Uncharacterized protein n=1 Tax=Escovopsis weberi TaxID=150374 RepID=A0A0M9VUR1_ESCWE|nr:hypothetical protein ESCO_005764 [Escovopsis weberi]